jgi:hypothetical protein
MAVDFLHPAVARRYRVAARRSASRRAEVVRADGEFAPRQGAALVAIERRELPGERRHTVRQARGAHGAIERREELRHKDRHLRLARVGAQDPAAVVRADARRRRREWRRRGHLGLNLRIPGIARSISRWR